MNNKNNITMAKFNLTKYYTHEEKIGPQGGGWAEPQKDSFADRYANIIFNQIKEEEKIANIIKTK